MDHYLLKIKKDLLYVLSFLLFLTLLTPGISIAKTDPETGKKWGQFWAHRVIEPGTLWMTGMGNPSAYGITGIEIDVCWNGDDTWQVRHDFDGHCCENDTTDLADHLTELAILVRLNPVYARNVHTIWIDIKS